MKKIGHNLIAKYLGYLAKLLIKKNHPLVIGITGSLAKTSTKEAIYQVLSREYKGKILKNEGNLNTDIGLPLAILGFKCAPKLYEWPCVLLKSLFRLYFSALNPLSHISILILEYAADKPGDIRYLTSIVKPNIAIITAIGPAHLANYQSMDQLREEKAQLVYALGKDDLAILNKKDANIKKIIPRVKAEIKYFKADLEEITEQIVRKIAEIFQINQKIVTNVLQNTSQLEQRMNIIQLKDITIIDDTYNANPLSMRFALQKLKAQSSPASLRAAGRAKLKAQRKIAVLGEMLELGQDSEKYHQQIGQVARKTADLVIGIGELAKSYQAHYWFKDQTQAETFLLPEISQGDIILFKASRKAELERLVEKIIERK